MSGPNTAHDQTQFARHPGARARRRQGGGRRRRRRAFCRERLRQRLLPAGQAGRCRARRKASDLGLRVFVGQKSRLRLLDRFLRATRWRRCPDAPSRWRGWRRKTNSPAWRPRTGWRTTFPSSIWKMPSEPAAETLIERARDVEGAALAVTGVTNSEGGGACFSRTAVALATSDGFYGRYAGTSHGIGVAVLAGEGTGMERDYDQASARHAGDLRKRRGRSAAAPARTRRQAAQSAQDEIAERAGGVTIRARPAGLLGHFAGAISGAVIARGVCFLKDRMGAAGVRARHQHHRRSASPARPALQAVRRRRRRQSAPRPDRERQAHHLAAGLRQRPAAGPCRPPAMPRAAPAARPRPPPPISTWKPGTLSPEALIADIKQGFYVTELMGMGVNGVTGDYSRGAAGFWIENGEIAYPVSEVTIAGNLKDMFAQPDAGQRSGIPPWHQCADRAHRRHDACRRLTPRPIWRLLEDAVREAGDIARGFFGGDYKRWSKAQGQPGHRSRSGGRQVPARAPVRGAARLWLAVGRKRRRSGAA